MEDYHLLNDLQFDKLFMDQRKRSTAEKNEKTFFKNRNFQCHQLLLLNSTSCRELLQQTVFLPFLRKKRLTNVEDRQRLKSRVSIRIHPYHTSHTFPYCSCVKKCLSRIGLTSTNLRSKWNAFVCKTETTHTYTNVQSIHIYICVCVCV